MRLCSLVPLAILASKQIFPALQAMIRHGHLDIPIIGVGRSAENLDCWPAEAEEIVAGDGGWHNPELVQEKTKGAAK